MARKELFDFAIGGRGGNGPEVASVAGIVPGSLAAFPLKIRRGEGR